MIQLERGRHVEWQVNGAWQTGHVLEQENGALVSPTGMWMGGCPFEHYGITKMLVLPWGDTLPAFVQANLLRDRPTNEVLNAAK